MKKFIINSSALRTAFKKLGLAVNPKTILPVLTNILVRVQDKVIELTASDQEMTITYSLEAETTGDGFEFLMPFQLIQKIVSLSGNQALTFTQEKKGIRITCESDVYDLSGKQKVEDFPKLPPAPARKKMVFDSVAIRNMDVALQTVGSDEKQPCFSYVLLELRQESTTIASSDGSFKLFSYALPIGAPVEDELLIIPKVIKALEGIDEVQLSWTEKNYAFVCDHLTIVVTRTDVKYLNWKNIIPPDFPGNLVLNRADLMLALQKCCLSTDMFMETKIELNKKGKISFHVKDANLGIKIDIELPGEYSGNVEFVNVNQSYMLKLLEQARYEEIELAIHDARRAIVFRSPADAAYTGVLMPLA